MSNFRDLLASPHTTPAAKAAIREALARPRVASVPRERSPLELRFLELWRANGGPELVEEYRFHETRKFRFDFAHVPSRNAFECEGGLYKGCGRHQTRKGFETDALKYMLAQIGGWTVWRLPSSLIQSRFIVALIARCEGREAEVSC